MTTATTSNAALDRCSRLVLLLVLCFGAQHATAQDHLVQHPIKAIVKGLKPTGRSVLFVSLLDEQGRMVQSQQVPVTALAMAVGFEPAHPGRYAIRLFQDENGNGELDLGLFKIPKEGVGCSNNAKGVMSAPALKDMLFDLKAPMVLTIDMSYY